MAQVRGHDLPTVRFESRIRPRVLLVMFMILWSGMAWVMTAVLGYGLITQPLRFPELLLVEILVLAAALLSTSWIIWQLRGKEVFELADDGITLWHANAMFKNRLFLRLEEVESILAEEDKVTPWWIRRQWGIGGGAIAISHNSRERRWGIDLGPVKAERIAREMRWALEERLAALN